ncbi:YebC/PmpR family DNA-binding transcriptional regulator [Chlamydiota bacterium]
MSGHSKWHTIRFKKAATDAKRGKLFSKLIKEITVATRLGGADINANPRLRTVVQKAKDINMPAENIDRAIKKGSGELPGVSYEEQLYEGYGPGGVAIIVEVLTDNKNRSAAEIRTLFARNGGNLAGVGSVLWMFDQKGLITVSTDKVTEDELFLLVTDGGAEDFKTQETTFEIICDPSSLEKIKQVLEDNNIEIDMADITYIAQNTVPIEGKEAEQVLRLMDALEDHDDVRNVCSNFDIPDELIDSEG